jgi:two-component system sensor histidine kinase KdpD
VKSSDSADEASDISLARELVAEFDGVFCDIEGDDIAATLVALARRERGTQIIVGSSHSRRWYRPYGGVIQNLLRRSSDLDLHVISLDRRAPR